MKTRWHHLVTYAASRCLPPPQPQSMSKPLSHCLVDCCLSPSSWPTTTNIIVISILHLLTSLIITGEYCPPLSKVEITDFGGGTNCASWRFFGFYFSCVRGSKTFFFIFVRENSPVQPRTQTYGTLEIWLLFTARANTKTTTHISPKIIQNLNYSTNYSISR